LDSDRQANGRLSGKTRFMAQNGTALVHERFGHNHEVDVRGVTERVSKLNDHDMRPILCESNR
jgi:hypothetical protein